MSPRVWLFLRGTCYISWFSPVIIGWSLLEGVSQYSCWFDMEGKIKKECSCCFCCILDDCWKHSGFPISSTEKLIFFSSISPSLPKASSAMREIMGGEAASRKLGRVQLSACAKFSMQFRSEWLQNFNYVHVVIMASSNSMDGIAKFQS